MSAQSPSSRVPAGVTTGGQFTSSPRGESGVDLADGSREQRQARIAAAMREAADVAAAHGAADLRGVQSRAALAVSLADYAAEVRTWQESGAPEVDGLVTRGLILLEETGAHEAFVARARRAQHDPDHLDSDGRPAALVEEVTGRVEQHLILQDAVLHSPLAGSTQLALSQLRRTGDGRPQIVLDHTEFVASAGGKENVTAILTPAGTAELWAGGQRVIGLGEHIALSAVVHGTGARASEAPAALADILRATSAPRA
jgi:hypothetical protein